MFDQVASDADIQLTLASLMSKGFEGLVVENKSEALEKIKQLIPSGVSVMNGTSMTLEQIGYIDYLKSGQHPWKNLHEAIVLENDPVKKAHLRKEALSSDFYLGSVHGLSQTGEMVIASNTGSQLPHIVFSSPNLIFVVGAQKITPSLEKARQRLAEYVFPLEDARIRAHYGVGSMLSKELIYHGENPRLGRKVRVIIVKEKLGF